MKRRFNLVVGFGLCIFHLAGCVSEPDNNFVVGRKNITPQGSTNFTSKTAGFSIYFPTKPETEERTAASHTAQSPVLTYRSITKPVTYFVVATALPPVVKRPNDVYPLPVHTIDEMYMSMMRSGKHKLEKRYEITLNGLKGREVIVSTDNGAKKLRAQIYLTSKFGYQIYAAGFKKDFDAQTAQIDKVFDSFRLTKQ